MSTLSYRLYVERRNPSRNMARFYALSIEPNLFGEACLVRRWGRIGAVGKRKIHRFDREHDAIVLFLNLLRQKRQRGYRAVGNITSAMTPAGEPLTTG